jgi:N-ethylmaleimide reductase
MTQVWEPIELGSIPLKCRLAMAPMTRDRSTAAGTPTELNAEYYGQRAADALVITEGTQPSADGQGYLLTPGIYSDEHVAGWRRVTDAVHERGGRIVIQLMHTGRVAHPENTPHGRQPVAPSAVIPNGQMFTAAGMQALPEPRALGAAEIEQTVEDFAAAARAAVTAGADGVEIHGADGYLIHQFLSSNANQREDRYGGDMAGRIRFPVEVARAVAGAIGADRVGIQISPGNPFNDISEDYAPELYSELVQALAPLGLAYLNFVYGGDAELLRRTRAAWPSGLILNRPGAEVPTRLRDLDEDLADVISFGRVALANPDWVARIRQDAPFNEADQATFYGGDARGYTDYPTLAASDVSRA